MIRSWRPIRNALALVLSVSFWACGDEKKTGDDTIPNALALVAVASDISLVACLGLQARTLSALGVPPSSPGGLVTPADTLFSGEILCPTVEATRDSVLRSLSLDFGSGCESDLDGLPASGEATFTVLPGGAGDYDMTAVLDGYAREGRVLEGTLNVKEDAAGITVNPSPLSLSGKSVSGVLAAFFSGYAKPFGAGPGYCREWILPEGGGSMTVAGFTYTFELTDTLFVSTCCPFPVRGEIMIGGGNLVPAFFDFGDGTCDNQARLTVSGKTQTIALGFGF